MRSVQGGLLAFAEAAQGVPVTEQEMGDGSSNLRTALWRRTQFHTPRNLFMWLKRQEACLLRRAQGEVVDTLAYE